MSKKPSRLNTLGFDQTPKHLLRPNYYDASNASKPAKSSPYVYNKETLGFKLDSEVEVAMFRDGAEPSPEDVEDFFDYGKALIKTIMNAQDNTHIHGNDWQRTVYIDTLKVNTTDFDLSDEKKQALVESGANGVKDYFKWYDNASGKKLPNNHPDFVLP